MVSVDGDEVVIQFAEESAAAQAEAARLAQKGGKRAAEGDYPKAIELLQRALKLQPSLHSARRDLAMSYVELGDAENATDHLIEVLRLDPADTWSWVVLGNLYLGPKNDPDTGEKFLRKALALKPDDAWALNSVAALAHQRGRYDEAMALFEQAIAANPELANPYYGEAMTLAAMNEPDRAEAVLQRLFTMGLRQDTRTTPVYEQARLLYVKVQEQRARRDESAMFKCVQDYRAELETASGYPVRTQVTEFKDSTGARIQMAWTHGRDHHLLSTRIGYPAELLLHLQAHELTHLKIETAARQEGVNRTFVTTARTEAAALAALQPDADKLRRAGKPAEAVKNLHLALIRGLCGFLYNCPQDMFIERELHQRFPVLRSAQFLSVRQLAAEALAANTNRDFLKVTPRKVLRATLAMNGAWCLFLDDLFAGASAFAAPYRRMENFDMAQRLYQLWRDRASGITGGGAVLSLVDEFAAVLGLRDWYEWRPGPGPHEITAAPRKEGTTNDELLRQKHPAAVWYLLDALQRYDKLPADEVREIAFEIGLLGRGGLDYASPDKKYSLRSLPGESFSGLQLMCLMHAGFKRISPELDTGMDLNEPFLTALELFQQRQTDP